MEDNKGSLIVILSKFYVQYEEIENILNESESFCKNSLKLKYDAFSEIINFYEQNLRKIQNILSSQLSFEIYKLFNKLLSAPDEVQFTHMKNMLASFLSIPFCEHVKITDIHNFNNDTISIETIQTILINDLMARIVKFRHSILSHKTLLCSIMEKCDILDLMQNENINNKIFQNMYM